MNVETSQSGSTAVAAVSGRVDSANAKEFEEELSAIIDKGATGLVVDCGELNYISSAGLRVFLIAIRKTSAAGGGLPCAGCPTTSRKCWRSAASRAWRRSSTRSRKPAAASDRIRP